MMLNIADGAEHIYLALGATDFRKQTKGLAAVISLQFHLDPHAGANVFLFCNKKKNSVRTLRWDGNGFLLATKTLTDDLKFQCPRSAGELRDITPKQLEWLLSGLMIDQKKVSPEQVDKTGYCF